MTLSRLLDTASPHALRISPRDGHPALRKTARIGSRSALAVSRFRLRARLVRLLHTSSSFRPARHYPRVWIWRSSSERQRDFNPPEQRAAQRTLRASPPPQTARPGSRELPVDRATAITAGASRVASGPLCLHAVGNTPAGPTGLFARTPPSTAAFPVLTAGRLLRYSFRCLLSV